MGECVLTVIKLVEVSALDIGPLHAHALGGFSSSGSSWAPADANIDRQKAESIATEIFDAIHDNVCHQSGWWADHRLENPANPPVFAAFVLIRRQRAVEDRLHHRRLAGKNEQGKDGSPHPVGVVASRFKRLMCRANTLGYVVIRQYSPPLNTLKQTTPRRREPRPARRKGSIADARRSHGRRRPPISRRAGVRLSRRSFFR
jgi:hypothetical protein